jgi:hypothetical protein
LLNGCFKSTVADFAEDIQCIPQSGICLVGLPHFAEDAGERD